MASLMEGIHSKVKPFVAGLVASLQAGGFMLWYHDYIGVESMVISGPSMLPTFNQPRLAGDIVFLERVSCWLPYWLAASTWIPTSVKQNLEGRIRKLQKGDVVVAFSPLEISKLVCKRLVAMEGETVYVWQEGSEYSRKPKPVTVPKGHVWLEGDCPQVSRDSREYGAIPVSMIRGRAWVQIWPIWSIGWVDNKKPPPK